MHVPELLVGAAEQVFTRRAPGTDECRLAVILAVHDAGEAIGEEELAHVVEVAFAAVVEAGVVAMPPQHIGQGEESLAAGGWRLAAGGWRLADSLTTDSAGVGGNPVRTASMPRTERLPVAYSRSNAQPCLLRRS